MSQRPLQTTSYDNPDITFLTSAAREPHFCPKPCVGDRSVLCEAELDAQTSAEVLGLEDSCWLLGQLFRFRVYDEG